MSESEEANTTQLATNLPQLESLPDPKQLKASKRREMIAKLDTLFELAATRAANVRLQTRFQQRWMTICAQLAQVHARIVTDLEYERLRTDIDKLVNRVIDSGDAGQRPIIHRPQNVQSGEEARETDA